MKFLGDSTTLVIVGQWNPAVLQPPWLAKYAFGLEDADVPVEIEVLLNGPLRITMQNVCIVPRQDRLLLSPAPFSRDRLDRVQSAAANILVALPHTPVAALGLNFRVEGQDLSADKLGVFEGSSADLLSLSYGIEVMERTIKASLSIEGRRLNLTRKLAGGKLTVEFNFHHATTSAIEARDLLVSGPVFGDAYDLAVAFNSELYGMSENASRVAASTEAGSATQ